MQLRMSFSLVFVDSDYRMLISATSMQLAKEMILDL
jgi:hypothetical protein